MSLAMIPGKENNFCAALSLFAARNASMIHTSCEELIELELEVSEPEKCEEVVP